MSAVFTIPSTAPFLDALADGILDGRLVPGFSPGDDPLALASLTLYLPTRRSARAVRESFLKRAGRHGAVLLPRIRPLGDIDEDDVPLDSLDAADDGAPPFAPPLPPVERQLLLTQLVLGWSSAVARATAGYPHEEPLIPVSPGSAARMAAELGGLIDQVGAQGGDWGDLARLVHDNHARHWAITAGFLAIAAQAWPGMLAERGAMDEAARRDALLRAEAARLGALGSPGPVVAVGSPGTLPATAALLAAIARLPNGAVVLPGLDTDLDEAGWRAIDCSGADVASAGHPQYGLKKLLAALGVERGEVRTLAAPSAPDALRCRFVSHALRPTETTDAWSAADADFGTASRLAALDGVALIEAANEREEALAASLVLRRAIERPGAVAALVTPDRGLARRVAVELERWGIRVDDSGGLPLSRTPPGVLARLVAAIAVEGCEAATLLALLKHPLTSLGMKAADARRAACALERAVMRGPRLAPGLDALRAVFDAGRARAGQEGGKRGTAAARNLDEGDWALADDLLARLRTALGPLASLAEEGAPLPLPVLLAAHGDALLAVAEPAPGETGQLFSDEAGEVLSTALRELAEAAPAGPALAPAEYPDMFDALLADRVVRRQGGLDPRVHIWGTLEARLQHVDVVVLGSLNEDTWPAPARGDPFLSRAMRTSLAIEPPERRTGLAAHDFAQGLGHREVWLSRAKRQDGTPQVASRFLQRVLAFAGADGRRRMAERGAEVIALAHALDDPGGPFEPCGRPAPKPPVELRPKRLSVTEIETLIRDPYAIFARHVLGLEPFEALAEAPDARDRGTLLHDILERFIRETPRGPYDDAAHQRLLAMGREAFAAHRRAPEVETLWWPRFERVAAWFIREEAARGDVVQRIVEAGGGMDLPGGFRLTGRADRIDRLADGRLRIVDYKTGTPPGVDEVLSLSPQLPLEALIAEAGGFSGVRRAEIAELVYYHLKGRDEEGGRVETRGVPKAAKGEAEAEATLRETIARTRERLEKLLAHHARAETGYLSRKIPRRERDFAGAYDHLARVAEWSAGEGE